MRSAIAEGVKIPVETIDQMKNIPKREESRLEPEGASFAELLGLALRPEDADIDLLPEANQEEQRLEVVKNNIVTALIVAALIIVTTFGVVLKKLHDKIALTLVQKYQAAFQS